MWTCIPSKVSVPFSMGTVLLCEFSATLRRGGGNGAKSGLFRVFTGWLDSEEQLFPFVMLAGWRRASAREGLIE